MQFLSKLVLTAAVFASSAYALCFKRGDSWNNRNAANSYLQEVCTEIAYAGAFNFLEFRYRCRKIDSGQRVDFTVMRIGKKRNGISVLECMDGFSKEINGCSQGGHSVYENWEYTSDPNAGSC